MGPGMVAGLVLIGAVIAFMGFASGFFLALWMLQAAIPFLPRHTACPVCGRTGRGIDD